MITFLLKKNNKINIDYYISNEGSDSNDGTINNPFATIDKLKTVLVSDKTVAFRCGDVFYGYLYLLNLENITVTSYGVGSNPKIRNAKIYNNFVQNGNIYSIHDESFPSFISETFTINKILKDEEVCKIGRYPKEGWWTQSGGDGGIGHMVDNSHPYDDGYWDACQIVMYPNAWSFERKAINTYINNSFNFYTVSQNYTQKPYFIQNHVNCLSVNNEFAYNCHDKTVYLYSDIAPTSIVVPIVVGNGSNTYSTNNGNTIEIENCNNITIENINFDISTRNHIFLRSTKNIIIKNNKFSNTGLDGIFGYNNHDANIEIYNNIIEDIDNTAIFLDYNSYINIYNNTINRVSIEIGMGWDNGFGITENGCHHSNIYYNNIDTSERAISLGGCGEVNVHHNYINNFGTNTSDVGGIYLGGCSQYNNLNSGYNNIFWKCYINNNIILNGQLNHWTSSIYIDDGNEDHELIGNYTYNASFGLHIKGKRHTVLNNMFIINVTGVSAILLDYYQQSDPFQNNNLVNNTSIIESDTSHSIRSNYTTTNYTCTGNTLSNKYYYPFGNQTYSYFAILNGYSDLAGWKNDDSRIDMNRDLEQIITPSLWTNSIKPKENYLYPIINPTKNIITINSFDLPYVDYIDLLGIDFGTSRIIQPYSSLVLVRKEN